MESNKDQHIKIAVIGSTNVGKTSIIRRFIGLSCSIQIQPTTCEFFNITHQQREIEILDISGSDIKNGLYEKLDYWINWADGIILVYSIDDISSFTIISTLIVYLKKKDSDIPFIIVGNKQDKDRYFKRHIKSREGIELAVKYGVSFYEVSARINLNINEMFNNFVSIILKNNISQHSNIQKIASLVSDLNVSDREEFISSGRYLIMNADVYKLSSSNQRKEKHLFLFNDYLVYGKLKGGIFNKQCKQSIHLSRLVLIDGNNEKDGYTFTVLNLENYKKIKFLYLNEKDRNRWFDAIEDALVEFKNDPIRIELYDEIARYQTSSNRLIGIPLRNLMKNQRAHYNDYIPIIVNKILSQLELENNISTPGLFRFAESNESLREIRAAFNLGKEYDISTCNPITLSSLLQLFLKLMPNTAICSEFNEVLFSINFEEDDYKLKLHLSEILSYLPTENYYLLSTLLKFANKLLMKSKENKLTLEYVSNHFMPYIFLCTKEYEDNAIKLTKYLIDSSSVIFRNKISHLEFLQPAPDFLLSINISKSTKLNDFKSKLLYLFNLVKERDIELASHLQSIIILFNSLLSYDLIFVQGLIDTTYFDEFHNLISELELVLTNSKYPLSSKGFKLTHSEKRKFLDIYDQLQYKTESIYEYLDSMSNWTSDERIAYFKIKKGLERNAKLRKEIGLDENKSYNELMDLLHPILSDKDACSFWSSNFGLEKLVVDIDIFISSLTEHEPEENERRVLYSVFDNSHTGLVNMFGFSQFLLGFGPFKVCVQNVSNLLKEIWFYGYITHEDSVRLLELEKPGTFLVRFTNKIPGFFTIEYVISNPLYQDNSSNSNNELKINTIDIKNSPHGFHLDESCLQQFRSSLITRKESIRINRSAELYPTIQAIFQRNSKRFMYPLNTTLYRNTWFQGYLPTSIASKLLADKPEGTFLVAFSSEIGCLTCSFVYNRGTNNTVEHFRLERLPDSKVKQGSKIYDSIEECIIANSKWLKTPYEEEHRSVVYDVQEGSVEEIVEKLYNGEDFSISKTFLLTYRSFASPTSILHILRERFNYYKNSDEKKYRLRIANFLKVWINEYFWDIKDDKEFLKNCKTLLNTIIKDNFTSNLGNHIETLLQNQIEGYEVKLLRDSTKIMRTDKIISELSNPNQKNSNKKSINNSVEDDVASSDELTQSALDIGSDFLGRNGSQKLKLSKKNLLPRCVLDINCQELAQQITLIELELFTNIAPYEFLNQGWLKNDKEERSPNLLKMIRFSNRMIRWVANEILFHEKINLRVKTMEYFVNLTKELIKLNNYNAALEIIAGFGNSSVGRLKKTWSAFSKSKKCQEYEEYKELLTTDGNWATYRNAFSKSIPPKIPYLGLILTDLVFIEDGNPDRLSNGHLNWIKFERIAEVLHNVQLCQQERYPFNPNDTIVDTYLFEIVNPLSIDEAYKRSLELEPREVPAK